MKKTGLMSCRSPNNKVSIIGSLLALSFSMTSLTLTSNVMAEETVPQTQSDPATPATPEDDFKAGVKAYENNDWFASLPPLRRAAATGHLPSMVMLGTIFNRAAESAEALIWYHKAAKAGSLEGAYWLGTMLTVEIDALAIEAKKTPAPKPDKEPTKTPAPKPPDPAVKPDEVIIRGPEEALKWISVAAEGNHLPAMFSMYTIFSHGKLGQLVDPKVALDWLQRAADKNFTPAMKELARAYAQGLLGLPANPKEAQRLEKVIQEFEQVAIKALPKPPTSQKGTPKK